MNYFRFISTSGGWSNSTPAYSFMTLPYNPILTNGIKPNIPLFEITNQWRYTSNNLDFTAGGWTAYGYNDSAWHGPGPGSFYVEENTGVPYRNTPLPSVCDVTGIPCSFWPSIPTAYYYRTHFTFLEAPSGTTLTFSNYVDDGAVYYLNGVEIYRLHMDSAPAPIYNATLATGYSSSNNLCTGDACVPEMFVLAGGVVNTNLRQGDNVLAVESHNYTVKSVDAVFGCALQYNKPPALTTNQLLVLSDGPITGVPITVSPGDAYGASSNATPAEFYYVPSAIATLRTPAAMGSNSLLRWQVDGADFSTNTSITLNMTTNRVVRAVYGVVQRYTLTIAASNAVSAVAITVSPTDLNGQGNGTTPFQRSYSQGTTITLLAPTNSGLSTFVKWQTNGVDMTTNRLLTILIDNNVAATAVFKSAPPVAAPLTINQFGTNVVLSWTNPAFSLWYATNLAKPIYWTNVPGIATNSPYTNPTIGPRRFFQLQY